MKIEIMELCEVGIKAFNEYIQASDDYGEDADVTITAWKRYTSHTYKCFICNLHPADQDVILH